MKKPVLLFILGFVAAQASYAQSTNEVFKMRATVVSIGRVDGFTRLDKPYVRFDRSQFSLTVRVESIVPRLTAYTNGSLTSFSFWAPSNLFAGEVAQGKMYDFVVSPIVPGTTAEPFGLKEPPKPVSQPGGAANRSQPVRPATNKTSTATDSGR